MLLTRECRLDQSNSETITVHLSQEKELTPKNTFSGTSNYHIELIWITEISFNVAEAET